MSEDAPDGTRGETTAPPPAATPSSPETGERLASWGAAAVVAVKVAGLYCLLQALPIVYLLPAYVIAMSNVGGLAPADFTVGLLIPVVYLIAGFLLVMKANWVTTEVLGFADPHDVPPPPPPGEPWTAGAQAIAFSVLGVWLAVTGVGELLGAAVEGLRDVRVYGEDVTRGASIVDWRVAIAAGVKIAAGFGLFFGGKRLAEFWRRARTGPADVPEGPPPAPGATA